MSTDVSSVTSHFPVAENGFTTTTSGSVAAGAVTVGLNSVAGYSNGDIAVFVIDPSDATKKQTFTGAIDTSGVQVTNVVWTAGTNTTHAAGATVVDYETATHWSMVSKGILVEHNQDGTHDEALITSRTAKTSTTTSDITLISDASASNALKKVTLDNLVPDSAITTAKINDGAVTPSKIDFDPLAANVATSENSSSTTYGGLATAQAVTVTVGANGLLLVGWGAQMANNGASTNLASIALSGGNTLAASDDIAITTQSTTPVGMGKVHLFTGLSAGSTTVTMQYRVTGNTLTALRRSLWALPL